MGEDKDWRILDHISWGANCYRRLDYSGRRVGRGACLGCEAKSRQ